MNQEEREILKRLSAKLLPKIDDDLMKNILLAMILMADQEGGEEFKELIKKRLIEKL